MKTYASLQSHIAALQKEADALRLKEVAGVVARIKQDMQTYGLSVKDIGAGSVSAKASGKKVTGKNLYRDPATGKTWTGHGRAPGWLAEAPDRSVYLVSASSSVRTANGASTGARGPKRGGDAKYKDPASDRTWTGRGKPPEWIAGAKDRDEFLINKPAASNAVEETAPVKAAKKTPAKKASAKKTVAKKAVAKKAALTRRTPAKKALPVGPAAKKGRGIKSTMSARANKALAPSPVTEPPTAA